MAAIRLQGVSKSFGDFPPVLKDVNLDIGESEFCVFLGPSGCGKSTLLRIVAGLEDATGGDIEIAGQRVNAVPAAKRGVAMVFQSYALFPHMTVAENMGFGLKLAKKTPAEVQQKVLEAARILQLEALLDRKPKALSGGQRQRVAIGRAIVREPGVFLFDEPLSNLDTTLRGQTRLEIAKLHASFKQSSTVYVTHDQVEAMTLADKIVLLNAGKDTERYGSIAQVGAPLELYHSPNSKFVAGFIGSPQMNFMAARVLACDAHGVALAIHATGQTVRTHHRTSQLQVDQELTLGIRPEHLRPCAPQTVDSVDASVISGVISAIERLGEQTYVHFSCGDSQSLIASVPGNTAHRMGEAITLAVPAEHCHLFTADGRAVQQN